MMAGKGALKFGIKSKLLVALVTILTLPLAILGGLALSGMRDLGSSAVGDIRDMGNSAVNESASALGGLAKSKMVAMAEGVAARTESLVVNAGTYAGAFGAAARDLASDGDRAALASLLSTMYSDSPRYDFIEYNGRRTGETFPLYDSLFLFSQNGTLLAMSGLQPAGSPVGQVFASQHYFGKAAESFKNPSVRLFMYDPYITNNSGRNYWEPADNVEDMIRLPRSDIRPFFVAEPANLAPLSAQTLEQQKSKSTRIFPSEGNWNAHQTGIIVLVPVRNGAQISAIAGLTMSLPAVTQFMREVKGFEDASGKSGYAYGFNGEGVLIAHPTRDHIGSDSTYHWWIEEMHKTGKGILDYTWRGVAKYTSFASIPSLGWKIAVTSPKTDFTQPAVDTGKNITSANNRTLSGIEASGLAVMQTTAALSLVFVIISVALGLVLANRIVRPIGNLTRLAERISRGNLDAEILVESNDELGALAEAFVNLLTTLRLGNTAYYMGDLRKALDSYRKGLALFETSGNEKGMAMCQNNMGNIFRQWKQFSEAEEYYRKALDIGQRLGDRKGVAMRVGNLGLLYKARGDGMKAMENFGIAFRMYTELGDETGQATIYNNYGIVKKEAGDTDGALEYFQQALALDRKTGNERGMATRYNNIALIHKARGDCTKALQCLEYALSLDQKLEDAASAYTSLRNLSVLYDEMGQADRAQDLAAQAAALKAGMKRSKSVMFVMDRSSSMDGDRIIAAKIGALNVLKNRIYGEDRVGIIQFDNEIQVLLPLSRKKDNYDLIREKIEGITLRSQTAFYDALGAAMVLLKENGGGDILWVVALTDGEDNASHKFTPARSGYLDKRHVLRDYPEALGIDVNMILIGVGPAVDAGTLAEICRGHGSYIHVTETEEKQGIIEAYKKVEEIFEESEVVEEYEPEK